MRKLIAVPVLLALSLEVAVASENENSASTEWGSGASKGCCIRTVKGVFNKNAKDRSYEYKTEDDRTALIRLDGSVIFNRNGQTFTEVKSEFSKVCKSGFGTDVYEIVSRPVEDGGVMSYPKVIEARCMSEEIHKKSQAYRDAVYSSNAARRQESEREKQERILEYNRRV